MGEPASHLWYLMKAGKVVPSSQCRKVERGTGRNRSIMSRVAAQPKAPDTLHAHDQLRAFHQPRLCTEECCITPCSHSQRPFHPIKWSLVQSKTESGGGLTDMLPWHVQA